MPQKVVGRLKSSDLKFAPRSGGVRFAPSPTGHFHLGNLRTAWISYQMARETGLPWVVRYEDIDKPRVVAGARELQTADLVALGLLADIELLQSEFFERHWSLFTSALDAGQIYACDCSRREVQSALSLMASAPHEWPAVYSGHCRDLDPLRKMKSTDSIAWRFKMPDLSSDFIIARSTPGLISGKPSREGFVPAYHWACAIDDYDGGYKILVRSADLASVTPLQRAIQGWIAGFENRIVDLPAVFHTSLVVDRSGHRLEKRTQGVRLSEILDRGLTTQELIAKFGSSFTIPNQFDFSIAGEPLATISLSDLGLL